VGFKGAYDAEDDDFNGATFFLSPQQDDGSYQKFRTADKRLCGFLFLRTLRTGRRALSLERGSLLDIILRLQERRLQMWEDILSQLRTLPVAEKEELGIQNILSSVQDSVGKFVHSEWASSPHMRVSDLTRESLRRIVTVFMETGAQLGNGSMHAAPFQHQGTGTINTLVLALLSQIAELKQNVIFAMEEPEIAIPPHTQKRIVDCIRQQSAQALFTSHSPYVLEEFDPANVLVVRREDGILTAEATVLPPAVKLKAYRTELKTRFCEALLARRVLIVEGRTEYDAIRSAARRLHELSPSEFRTLEGLGIAVVDAQSDSQVAPLGEYFGKLGKQVFALFDRQTPESKAIIEKAIPNSFENPEFGFEDLLLKQCGESALRRFALQLVSEGNWPAHLSELTPKSSDVLATLQEALSKYMKSGKGAAFGAELLGMCLLSEFPTFIRDTLREIQRIADPVLAAAPAPDEEHDPFLGLL
jgi:putative ATP-dependent endonuclease of OLD family